MIDNLKIPLKEEENTSWETRVLKIEPAEAEWVRQRVKRACKEAGVRALHKSAFKKLVSTLLKENGLAKASDADLEGKIWFYECSCRWSVSDDCVLQPHLWRRTKMAPN